MSSTHRVVIATDIPFWQQANGAQQRMAALWRTLSQPPFACTVFYLGATAGSILDQAHTHDVNVVPFQPSPTPGLFGSALAKISALRGRGKATAESKGDASLTLSDYRWPEAQRQLARLLSKIQPQTVVLEYVTMSYLADTIRRTSPHCRVVLDSHDILHRRCAQFEAAGYRHWLQIREAEEVKACQAFDVILAIQDEEAGWFRQAAPRARVLTVGHSFDFRHLKPTWRSTRNRNLTVGYFGSLNGSNIDAITQFVQSAWPKIFSSSPGDLLIAGTIAAAPTVEAFRGLEGIRLRRELESPHAFYDMVDLVINPVRFGTGLKIKTIEALAHGRPVVTTIGGQVGVPAVFADVCIGVEQVGQMVEPIVALLSDADKLFRLSRQTFELAKEEFSDERVLAEFRRLLLAESARPDA